MKNLFKCKNEKYISNNLDKIEISPLNIKAFAQIRALNYFNYHYNI